MKKLNSILLLNLLFVLTSCYRENYFDNILDTEIIQFENLTPIKILADGHETVEIKATISKAAKEDFRDIEFINAPPEKLKIILSSLILKAGIENEVTVEVLASRSKGTPTVGNKITINLFDKNGKDIGIFRKGNEVETDMNGNCNLVISMDTLYIGECIVKASLKDNISIENSSKLQIIRK